MNIRLLLQNCDRQRDKQVDARSFDGGAEAKDGEQGGEEGDGVIQWPVSGWLAGQYRESQLHSWEQNMLCVQRQVGLKGMNDDTRHG